MNPERYARIREIFLAAVALPDSGRRAYLDGACASDPSMRGEVESLLSHGERPGGLLETGAIAAALDGDGGGSGPAAPSVPERIGPCRILGLLGEGGMGVVYRAEQLEPVRREVALKLIKGGEGSAAILARFDAERQVLAVLDHPGIARLYEAGCTDAGNPYFLMELVRGVPLGQYLRHNPLPQRERVELFARICSAVRHAHQKRIIHRDLKPSNIMVSEAGERPEPKIIDFSIARAVSESVLRTQFRTREGQVIGTLEYMAPEQALGRLDAIDARTDVYALGVILYEMLAGQLPIEIVGLPMHEAVRRIAETPPDSLVRTRGARGTTKAERIDDDLATIVGKCLEKEPERRYDSAAELADDVERYLRARPIVARPPSLLYQLRKLVARHRLASAFAGTVLVLLIGFLISTQAQLAAQRRARAHAEAAALRAERVGAFLQDLLESADPGRTGGKVSIREALDWAAEAVDASRIPDPEIRAAIHLAVGRAYIGVGEPQEAMKHFLAGLADRREVIQAGGSHDLDSARLLIGVATSTNLGDHRRSLAAARLAASIATDVEGPQSPTAAEALASAAWANHQLGRNEVALAESARAVAIIRSTAAPPREMAKVLTIRALLLQGGPEGVEAAREAVEATTLAHGEESQDYLEALNALGLALQAAQGVTDEVIAIREKVVDGFRRIYGDDSSAYAMAVNNLATTLLVDPRRLDEAAQLFEKARAIWHKEGVVYAQTAWGNHAYVRLQQGKYAAARAIYEAILQDQQDRNGMRALTLLTLGCAEHLDGANEAARRHLEESLEIHLQIDGPDGLTTAASKAWLGCLLLETGQAARAESLLREAYARWSREPINEYTGARFIINRLGHALAAQGKRAEAEAAIQESRPFLMGSGKEPKELRHALETTSRLYDAWGRHADAAELRAALRRLEDVIRSGRL